jgi:hypothetical protein
VAEPLIARHLRAVIQRQREELDDIMRRAEASTTADEALALAKQALAIQEEASAYYQDVRSGKLSAWPPHEWRATQD